MIQQNTFIFFNSLPHVLHILNMSGEFDNMQFFTNNNAA